MGFDKLIELAQSYARDYVFAALAILSRPDGSAEDGSAEAVLTPANPRTWVFCLISISLGSLSYTAAISRDLYTPNFEAFGAVITLWLWILFAGISHGMLKLLHGKGQFLDTLGVCLRILPVAYMMAGFIALTISLFARGETGSYPTLARYAFLGVQFLILAIYLPPDLRRAHNTGPGIQVALMVLLPAIVLGVNMLLLSQVVRDPPAAAAPAATTAPAPPPAGVQSVADVQPAAPPAGHLDAAAAPTPVEAAAPVEAPAPVMTPPPAMGPAPVTIKVATVPAAAPASPEPVPMMAVLDANKLPPMMRPLAPKDLIAVPVRERPVQPFKAEAVVARQ